MAAEETDPTGPAAWLVRPALVPLVERFACCQCGGGGLDSAGHTCPHCDGTGHT